LNTKDARDGDLNQRAVRPSRLRRLCLVVLGLAFSISAAQAQALAGPVAADNASHLIGTPEARASASKMTPNDVMAKMGQTISFVARQKPAFAMIRPKRASMTGRTYYFWGGKDTCRPGHSNDPELYLLKDMVSKSIVGDCLPGFPIRSGSRHLNSPGLYTSNMDKVAAALEARDGLNIPHGNTTSIKATNTTAKFTFKCDEQPGDTTRSLKINSQGKIVATTKCKGSRRAHSKQFMSAITRESAGAQASTLKQECIQAGLAPPSLLRVHFELNDAGPEHRNVTIPRTRFRYRVGAMPEACQGQYRQVVQVKLRYKTSILPPKTFTAYQVRGDNEKLVGWMTLYSGATGTNIFGDPEPTPPGGYTLTADCSGLGWLYVFGQVRYVKALARLSVKEEQSGELVARRTRKQRVSFSRSRKPAALGGDLGCYGAGP
jgi:hypothetical protein